MTIARRESQNVPFTRIFGTVCQHVLLQVVLARASHPDCCNAGCARERGCQAGVSSHAARIARSNAVPRIEHVPCLLCPVCLCYRAQCVAFGTAAAPATPVTTLGTHALVPLHPLQHSASCMSQSFLRLRTFRWHVCICEQILSGLLTG